MGIDYYGVLQLNRNCTNLDVKQAYRDLALEFNPERLKKKNAHQIFILIAEAYDVLSDPLKRAIFDQYGEEGLKRGIPGPTGYIEAYYYHGDAMRTYKEFFGTASPYADLLNYLDDPQHLECLKKTGTLFCQKQPPIKHPLALTLHEVFFGGIKKMKIHHLIFINDEKTKTEVQEKLLTVPINPGVKGGTEIMFPEEGDQSPHLIPADVIFITEDKPHETFVRQEDDLVMQLNVGLEEALMGTVVTVNTIDHRIVRVPITDVISPGYEKLVENEGLPILEQYPKRGHLRIRFNVHFPKYLPSASKKMLQKGFELAKIGGGVSQYETINKLVLADKILRVDLNEQLPP